jgi:hypothetical protein
MGDGAGAGPSAMQLQSNRSSRSQSGITCKACVFTGLTTVCMKLDREDVSEFGRSERCQ